MNNMKRIYDDNSWYEMDDLENPWLSGDDDDSYDEGEY